MPEEQEQLAIPHSIILIEVLDLVCVADRENGRYRFHFISNKKIRS